MSPSGCRSCHSERNNPFVLELATQRSVLLDYVNQDVVCGRRSGSGSDPGDELPNKSDPSLEWSGAVSVPQ